MKTLREYFQHQIDNNVVREDGEKVLFAMVYPSEDHLDYIGSFDVTVVEVFERDLDEFAKTHVPIEFQFDENMVRVQKI